MGMQVVLEFSTTPNYILIPILIPYTGESEESGAGGQWEPLD